MHRIQGTPRYAPPPMGTYSPALGHPDSSAMAVGAAVETSPFQPPVSSGLPPPPTSGTFDSVKDTE